VSTPSLDVLTPLPGKILNLGADWSWRDNKTGLSHADTRYQLQTDDGANIYIQTEGPTQSDGTIHLRETFETGSDKYYWLNNIVAIGVLRLGSDGVIIDAWQASFPSSFPYSAAFM
jgi:hypothetical protein